MKYYGLSGKMTARPNKQDELLGILLKAAELLERNDDCIHYVICRINDGNSVWINEAWTSKEAHDASLQPLDIRELVMSALPLLESKPESGTEYFIVGGKGL